MLTILQPQVDIFHPPILYYIVTNPLTNTVINTTNTSVIITGLNPDQYYNINITVVNIIGPGPVLMINGKLICINMVNKEKTL